MNIVKHDPYKDKLPLGGVKTNQKFYIIVYINKSQFPYNCQLLICFNGTGEIKAYPMAVTTFQDDLIGFSAELSIDTVGLYSYFFSYCSKDQYFYIGKNGNEATVGSFLPQWQLTVYHEDFTTPEWIKGGIIYQIFPDRFSKADTDSYIEPKQYRKVVEDWYSTPEFIYDTPDYKANDFFMGNLKGIVEKLDYLKSLNVTAIYLNPIFESAENHRYSTADYMSIDPYLGKEEDFIQLATQCELQGIRLILDGVFSHTGADSIYFNKFNSYGNQGAYNTMDSPYFSWYRFKHYPYKYECWWNFTNLPNVNEEDPKYLDFITNRETGVLAHWLERGAYGYRLDVVDELPDGFLDRLRESVKSKNPDALVIGEVWEDATTKEAYGVKRRYLLGNQLDSVMNYPWRDAIIQVVTTKNTEAFYYSIMSLASNYPPESLNCMMNLLSTHDTVRIITTLGENRELLPKEQGSTFLTTSMKEHALPRLKLAAFLQFTLPGVPSIYYGDEVGLEGFKDPYCRRGYPWGREDEDILEFYRALSSVRANNKVDFCGDFEFVYQKDGSIIYRRDKLYCLLNLNECSSFVDITLSGQFIFNRGRIELTSLGTILEAHSMHILKIYEE